MADMTSFWRSPPSGYSDPKKLPDGTLRKFCVRFILKDDPEQRQQEAYVEAVDYYEARVKAGNGNYYALGASVIFEKIGEL